MSISSKKLSTTRLTNLQERLDFGRLYCCGEVSKVAGHSWGLIPVAWFDQWCSFTGYDRYKDQAVWTSFFRKHFTFEIFDGTNLSEKAREHFSQSDCGIDLNAYGTEASTIVSRPGSIDLRHLLILNNANDENNDSDNLIGPRIKSDLREEQDYFLVPEEALKALIAWYGKVGPSVLRSMVMNSKRLIIDLYPELHRFEEGSLNALNPLELSNDEIDNQEMSSDVGVVTPTSPSRQPDPCAFCKNTSVSTKSKCSRCKRVVYCSEECQLAHWSTHKLSCKSPQAVMVVDPKKVNGKVGLVNLGNTCFMNSSLQALSAVWPLTEYFLSERYKPDINERNPLGTKGKLVRAYGALLEELWRGSRSSVAPSDVRRNVSSFTDSDMFRGYDQHDAHELLSFLIDGLHEDLNLILQKPAVVDEESDGSRPDEIVSRLSLEKYHQRNKSRIVDLMAGLFKNTVECHVCNKRSIKFDPFHVLTVPIPSVKSGSQRYCYIYLHRLFYDPLDPKTWNLLPVGSNSETADVFWATPRSANADYRGIAGEGTSKRFMRYLIGIDRSHFTVKEVRQELAAQCGIRPECLVFEAVSNLEFKDVYVDSTNITNLVPDIFSADHKNASHIIAFEVAPPKWHQPSLTDEISYVEPNDSSPIHDVIQRQSSARVLMLVDVRGKGNYYSYGSMSSSSATDSLKSQTCSFDEAFDSSISLGPQLLSVSKDTTITQLRFIAARQLYHLVGNKLRAHLSRTNGRPVTEVETIRTLASMLMIHTARMTCSADQARWLPGILPNGQDADGKNPASAQTIGDIGGGNCFKVSILETGLKPNAVRHLDFVWTKVVIFLRGDLHPFVDTSILDEFEEGPGSRDLLDSLLAKLKEPIKLEDCISNFSEPEVLDEHNLYYCGGCKQHSKNASKELAIWSLPDVVIIHLKRFKKGRGVYGFGGGLQKVDDLVVFPLVGLDLSKFELKSKNGDGVSRPSLYDCIAVVNHMGGMGGGHYTAYANHQISQFGGYGAKELQGTGGKWMLFDDSYVDFVEDPERRVVSKAAYVLVFQRRKAV